MNLGLLYAIDAALRDVTFEEFYGALRDAIGCDESYARGVWRPFQMDRIGFMRNRGPQSQAEKLFEVALKKMAPSRDPQIVAAQDSCSPAAMSEYEVRVIIGDACYRQGFVETGEYNSTWRSGCAVGAWVAQELAKLHSPTKEDVERLSRELVAKSFLNGSVE